MSKRSIDSEGGEKVTSILVAMGGLEEKRFLKIAWEALKTL